MGLQSQAPIGSLPTRSDRVWVNAARPTDRSTQGHEVVRMRGQAGPGSGPMMLTVVRIAAAAHPGRDARVAQAIGVAHRHIFRRSL